MSSDRVPGDISGQTDEAYPARWKRLARPDRDVRYRAICGRPGCPGSLGQLLNFGLRRRETADALFARRQALLEDYDLLLVKMEERTDLPPGMDREKRLASLAELRAQATRQRACAEEDRRSMAAIFGVLADRADLWDLLPDWAMRPEAPHRERGTPTDRSPHPIYHGHPDTGYRISLGGKRVRAGHRIGRRPQQTAPSGVDITPLAPRFADRRRVHGQSPIPPCRIFCPVCGSPNDVGIPPGFTIDEPSP